jgi:hypothetical protein
MRKGTPSWTGMTCGAGFQHQGNQAHHRRTSIATAVATTAAVAAAAVAGAAAAAAAAAGTGCSSRGAGLRLYGCTSSTAGSRDDCLTELAQQGTAGVQCTSACTSQHHRCCWPACSNTISFMQMCTACSQPDGSSAADPAVVSHRLTALQQMPLKSKAQSAASWDCMGA